MKRKVSSKMIQDLEEQMLKIMTQCTNSEYELIHYRNVCKYSSELAKCRELKQDRAKIAAILHDIGRLVADCANNHANKGALLARDVLQKWSFQEKLSNKICETIRNHSDKANVGKSYDELLKDADSLAHRDELGYENLKWTEQIRCDYAYETYKHKQLYSVNLSEISPLVLEKIAELKEKVFFESKEMLQKNNIHRVRILCNQLRMLCCIMRSENADNLNMLSKLSDMFGKIYKKTALLREFQVYLGMIPETSDWIEERRFLKDRIKEEEAKLSHRNWSKEFEYFDSLHVLNLELDDVENYVNKIFLKIQKEVRNLQLEDINKIHKLRIYGKKIIYLYDIGVINLDNELLDVLQVLHGKIGAYHDFSCMKNLFKKKKNKLWIENQMNNNNKQVKRDLFRLTIILSKYL